MEIASQTVATAVWHLSATVIFTMTTNNSAHNLYSLSRRWVTCTMYGDLSVYQSGQAASQSSCLVVSKSVYQSVCLADSKSVCQLTRPASQSVSQWVRQSVSYRQTISQTASHSVCLSVFQTGSLSVFQTGRQTDNQTVCLSDNQSICQLASQSDNQSSVHLSISQSVSQKKVSQSEPDRQTVNQSVCQPDNRSISQPSNMLFVYWQVNQAQASGYYPNFNLTP